LADTPSTNYTALTVELLASYVANNSVRSEDLAGLIASTHAALAGLDRPDAPVEDFVTEPEYAPAVTARKSLADPENIISMVDGKPYKTLKRHLALKGLTPDQYRQRYNLPASYPMTAPGYSEKRREVAKRLGLGRKPASDAAPAAVEPESAVTHPAKTPRKSKARATGV